MSDGRISIEVLSGDSADLASRAEAAQALLAELDQIPRLAPMLAETGPAPSGTKAVTENLPQILMALGAANAVLPTAINLVKDWLLRQPKQTTIRIKTGDTEIEWSGTTPPDILQQGLATIVARQTA